MLHFRFKNTYFFSVTLLLLLLISCGNKSTNQKSIQEKPIIVAANRTSEYLPLLKGKKVAVVANQTSIIFKDNGSYVHLIDSLISQKINIVKVFAPEHGFRGKADAAEHVADGKDTKTGLPIISLYGKNKKPAQEQLNNIDLIVFDIQDVGVRFYTYISTLSYVMEACAEKGVPILILDRPNPNGHYVDGPTLESKHSSFVSLSHSPYSLPLLSSATYSSCVKLLKVVSSIHLQSFVSFVSTQLEIITDF